MAENINISFAPNKAASESQRIADLEQYVSTLTERTKFAFASIIEEYNDTADDDRTVNMIYQAVSESGSDVGQFTSEYFSEIFNDYENNIATHPYSHAEGFRTSAKGLQAHAEGCGTTAGDNSAHAEGQDTTASAYASHAEGNNTKATGWVSHAEGDSTIASGMYSHAEGGKSESKAKYSHAEGESTQATGYASHAEGQKCIASGQYSHAGGIGSEAKDYCSFVHGYGLKTARRFEAVFGKYNDCDNPSLFSIGCGQSEEYRENALALNDVGDLLIKGKYKASNGYDFSNAIASSTALGAIKIGENLSISEDGTLSANVGEYTLPVATADTLGGVRIGDNITVTDDGTISVDLSSYLKSAEIADWAKQPEKPVYTADEVGAAAEQHKHSTADITDFPAIPTKVSDLQNDSGYISEETDPTVPAWAKAKNKPSYTAAEVGAAAKSHTHTKSEITDFPTLGTAAGKNVTDFYPAKAKNVYGLDYNSLISNGIFEVQGDAASPTANTPNGNHKNNNFYVQVFFHNAKYLTQIATSVRADKTQYIRSLSNGVWNNWEKIKSGDADTVDGKHASDFAAAGHTHTATEVGAATAADITAAVNAVEIGGRNLLYYSRFDKKYPAGWAYSAAVSYTFDGNAATLTKSETTARQFTAQASVSKGVVVANPNLLPENGCTYTISCEVMKAEGYDVGESTKVIARYNYTDGTMMDFNVDVSGASETAWTKYSSTYTYASDKEVSYTNFIIALDAKACGIRIKNVKFEKGNKPTDWTPAPEDDERRIASLEARVAALEAMAVSGGEV